MKHTNENDERLDTPESARAALQATIARKLRDQELGIEPDRERLIAENRAFLERFRGTWTGPRLTEAEIEGWVAREVPRNWLGHPLVVRIDEPGDHEERSP
jgi:hypothetical protein